MEISTASAIREEISSLQKQQLESIKSSGTWWTGMERSFFALQARSFVTGDKNPIQLDQINDLRSVGPTFTGW